MTLKSMSKIASSDSLDRHEFALIVDSDQIGKPPRLELFDLGKLPTKEYNSYKRRPNIEIHEFSGNELVKGLYEYYQEVNNE